MKVGREILLTFAIFSCVKLALLSHCITGAAADLARSHIANAKVNNRKTGITPRGTTRAKKAVEMRTCIGYRGRVGRQKTSPLLQSMQETCTSEEVPMHQESRNLYNRARGRGGKFVEITSASKHHRLAMRGQAPRKFHEKKVL
jgi:hypothetical protein